MQLKDWFAVLIVLILAARLRQLLILGYCLFATQNRDFLLEKRYTTHQQNRKTTFFGFSYKVKVHFNIRSPEKSSTYKDKCGHF